MGTKSFLITFAGYPYTPSSFLPDNGMANLASSLINNGDYSRILDYNNLNMTDRLFPKRYRVKIRPLIEAIMEKGEGGKKPGFGNLFSLSFLNHQLNRFQHQEFRRIAQEITVSVRKEKIDFVGLKLWNGDGLTASLTIARELKKVMPDLPIFAGGPSVDIFREEIFKITDDIDALSYGEGEETIVMLSEYVQGKKKLEEIPNLIFKKGKKIITTPVKRIKDLDTLSYPIYDEEIYPAMKGNQKIKIIVLDESRGCPNSCYFCIQPIKSGGLRTKSPGRVVDEIEMLTKKYKINVFEYAGSSTPGVLLKKIAEEILRRGLKVEYTTFGHIRSSHKEDFALLKQSGCYSIFFGIESGNQKILDKVMNKGVKISRMKDVLKASKDAGIFTVGSIIVPAPFETEKTKEETLKLLLDVGIDAVPVQFPGIYPHTEWALHPEKYNFELNKKTYVQKVMNYKIKLFFPPRFWKPLPYKVNGKSFRDFSRETEDFVKRLEHNGILTAVSDDLALLAKYAHLSPREYRDQNRLNFLTGNLENIQKQIEEINKNTSFA